MTKSDEGKFRRESDHVEFEVCITNMGQMRQLNFGCIAVVSEKRFNDNSEMPDGDKNSRVTARSNNHGYEADEGRQRQCLRV
ncbi:hypothetical protein U1Q18_046204 [Sarracenia purpurea var. burkii]